MVTKNLKKGMIFRVIGNTSSHNYVIGERYRISYVNVYHKTLVGTSLDGTWTGNNLYFNDIEESFDKDYVSSAIKDLEKKIVSIQDRLSFLEERDLDSLDEKEYKLETILKITQKDDIDSTIKKELISNLLKREESDAFQYYDDGLDYIIDD